MPPEAVRVYVDALRNPDALRSSFEFYRAIDEIIAQNTKRKQTKLKMPVLAVGGERAIGTGVETEMRTVAENVSGAIIAGDDVHLTLDNVRLENNVAVRGGAIFIQSGTQTSNGGAFVGLNSLEP